MVFWLLFFIKTFLLCCSLLKYKCMLPSMSISARAVTAKILLSLSLRTDLKRDALSKLIITQQYGVVREQSHT